VTDTIHVYKDNADPAEYRWRRIAANGEEVAESGEGYSDKSGAVEAATREADGKANILDDTED
jgi:uncharacterized protein YegP (UPF0339 family)